MRRRNGPITGSGEEEVIGEAVGGMFGPAAVDDGECGDPDLRHVEEPAVVADDQRRPVGGEVLEAPHFRREVPGVGMDQPLHALDVLGIPVQGRRAVLTLEAAGQRLTWSADSARPRSGSGRHHRWCRRG